MSETPTIPYRGIPHDPRCPRTHVITPSGMVWCGNVLISWPDVGEDGWQP